MPRMDGITFTQTLREGNCDLPVLMVTARVTQEDKRRGFRAGCDDYMVKPVDMDEMAAYVNGEEVPILPREFNVLYRK